MTVKALGIGPSEGKARDLSGLAQPEVRIANVDAAVAIRSGAQHLTTGVRFEDVPGLPYVRP